MDTFNDYPVRLSRWLYLSVLIAGAITVFAFSPFDFYPIAWLTPAVLFFALTKAKTLKQYFYLSWFYGLGLFGTGASWPFYSLYFFANAPLWFSLIATFLFVAIVAFFSFGLFGLLASLFRRSPLILKLLVFFPVSWVISEWFRGWFLTGFPWLYIGNSQIDFFFASIAPITGVLGVSLLSLMLSGALLAFILGDSQQKHVYVDTDPDSQIISNKIKVEEKFGSSFRILSALVIVLLITASFALDRISWTEKSGKPIKVSVLQSNISQKEKLNPDNLQSMIDLYRDMTRQSFASDVIIWPETALFDSFERHMSTLIQPLQQSLKNTNKVILMGGFYVNEKQKVENSVLAISAKYREIYSKRHLVPFGEYTPGLKYLRWLDQWLQMPYDNIDAGENAGVLRINDDIAQMTICYEDVFGEEMIEALPEASLLINVTHDGWFSGSLEPQQHMQIARMRSLEMGRYMVRSTTTGPAGMINEKGKVVATAPINSRAIITHNVQPYTGATPYVRWGNWFIIVMLSLILLTGYFWKKGQ